MSALTPPTPENVAEMLTSSDGVYHDGNDWHRSIGSKDNVVEIEIMPGDANGDTLDGVHFRPVVVEGETAPIVLEEPAELGVTWRSGTDAVALTSKGIVLMLGVDDEYVMDAAEAREWAAQLAAMADALDAANGGASNG